MQGASKKLNTAIARALSFLRVASAQVEQSAVVFAPTAAVDRVKAAPAPAPDCERLPGRSHLGAASGRCAHQDREVLFRAW